jgi:hypothetical protein
MISVLRRMVISVLCVGGLLGIGTGVFAQNVSVDVNQLKDQVRILQRDVSDLRDKVGFLEKQVMKPAGSSSSANADKGAQKKPVLTLKESELRAVACKAGDKFVAEVDAVLNLTDAGEAQERMDKALTELKATLSPYAGNTEMEGFISLAGAMAWDTYTAVGLRPSVEGNTEFLQYIDQHKRRFRTFCRGK